MIINGLLFGLISTLHCAGMCGPLALYVPTLVSGNKTWFALLYQGGRISVYILIGSLVFLMGYTFSLFKLQQVISIITGGGLILYVILNRFKIGLPFRLNFKYVTEKLRNKVGQNNTKSAFTLGVLNGLLPCGAIYIAALYCTTFVHLEDTMAYMFLFGLGTSPVFIAAWLFTAGKFKFNFRRWVVLYKWLPVLIGALMILRGSNLGIPYLSPKSATFDNKIEVKACCNH